MNLAAFYRWNSGNLLANRTRGAFAEWLVHQAFGIGGPGVRAQQHPAHLDPNHGPPLVRSRHGIPPVGGVDLTAILGFQGVTQ